MQSRWIRAAAALVSILVLLRRIIRPVLIEEPAHSRPQAYHGRTPGVTPPVGESTLMPETERQRPSARSRHIRRVVATTARGFILAVALLSTGLAGGLLIGHERLGIELRRELLAERDRLAVERSHRRELQELLDRVRLSAHELEQERRRLQRAREEAAQGQAAALAELARTHRTLEEVEAEQHAALAGRRQAEFEAYLAHVSEAERAWRRRDIPVLARALGLARSLADGWELRALALAIDDSLSTRAIGEQAEIVRLTPDAAHLIAISGDQLRLVDLVSGEDLLRQRLGRGPVLAVDLNASGRHLAIAGADGDVRVLDLALRRPLARVTLEGSSPTALSLSADGRSLAVGASDGSISLYDARTADRLARLEAAHAAPVTAVAISDEADLLASGALDGATTLWNLRTRAKRRELKAEAPASVLRFSRDGAWLASGDAAGRVRLFDASAAVPLEAVEAHGAPVESLAFDESGRRLLSSAGDLTVTLWNVEARSPIARLTGHLSPPVTLAFASESDTAFASASRTGVVKRWDAGRRASAGAVRAHDSAVTVLATPPAGEVLLTGSADATVRTFDPRTLQPLGREIRCDGPVVALSAAAEIAACLDATGTLRLWPWAEPQRVIDVGGSAGRRALALAPGGRWLAVGEDSGEIHVLDTRTQRTTATLHAHDGPIRALALSADGHTLASAGADGQIVLWQTGVWQNIAQLSFSRSPIAAIALSPRGERMAASSLDGMLTLVDLVSGESAEAAVDGAAPSSLAFSPDGLRLAAGAPDGRLGLWALDPLMAVLPLRHGGAALRAVAFDPEEETLFASSASGEVLIWRTRREREPAHAAAPSATGAPNAWVVDAWVSTRRGERVAPRAGEPFTVVVELAAQYLDADRIELERSVAGEAVRSPLHQAGRVEAPRVIRDAHGSWTFDEPGLHRVRVAIDPDNVLAEIHESDNSIEVEVLVLPAGEGGA